MGLLLLGAWGPSRARSASVFEAFSHVVAWMRVGWSPSFLLAALNEGAMGIHRAMFHVLLGEGLHPWDMEPLGVGRDPASADNVEVQTRRGSSRHCFLP